MSDWLLPVQHRSQSQSVPASQALGYWGFRGDLSDGHFARDAGHTGVGVHLAPPTLATAPALFFKGSDAAIAGLWEGAQGHWRALLRRQLSKTLIVLDLSAKDLQVLRLRGFCRSRAA